MASLEKLRQRMESAEDLQSVVTTMKTLAAANVRRYQRAVTSLDEYRDTVELALQIALQFRPAGSLAGLETTATHRPKDAANDKLGAIVFGSDQGLCGQFNQRIANHALESMNGMHIRHPNRSILSVGARVTNRLVRAHQSIETAFPVPGSLKGIVPAVNELLVHIQVWRTEAQITHIVLFHNQTAETSAYRPRTVHLLPLDVDWLRALAAEPWPRRGRPVIFMEWSALFSGLIQQYLFVMLHQVFTESMASENAARLTSMQAAERNIDEQLDEFRARYQQQRQDVITSELLDIVGGMQALSAK